MNTFRMISVLALSLSAVAFAGAPKTAATVKGIGAVQTDAFSAIVKAEVKGADSKKPARGDFDLYMKDADGNTAEFELRTIKSFTVAGKTATIQGMATWEIYGLGGDDDSFGDDDSGDDDGDDDESIKFFGPVTIVVQDLGNGKAGATPDRIAVSFNDPDTDGVDLEFATDLVRGNLTVKAGTMASAKGKKK